MHESDTMHSKNEKHRRSTKRSLKIESYKAEVFVLPPDLLSKLGIHLGKVQGCSTSVTNNTGSDISDEAVFSPKCQIESCIENSTSFINNSELLKRIPHELENNSHTNTLLETADLMKKSVLLSPTFVNITNNFNPEELAITSNVIEQHSDSKNCLNSDVNNVPFMSEKNAMRTLGNLRTEKLCQQSNSNATSKSQIVDLPINLDQDINKIKTTKPSLVDVTGIYQQTNDTDTSNTLVNEAQFTLDHPFYNTETKNLPIVEQPLILDEQGTNIEQRISNTVMMNETEAVIISNIAKNSGLVLHSEQDVDMVAVKNNAITEISRRNIRAESADDHLDEAYLSDCSNSNSGPSDNAAYLNYLTLNLKSTQEQQNKVKIISEEILSPSKFMELKMLHSPKNCDLRLISKNCLIPPNKKPEKRNSSTVNHKTFGEFDNSILSSPYYSSVNHNGDKNVLLYDIKGNVISPEGTNGKSSDIPSSHSENNFEDIDFVIIGLDKIESEEVLEKFANEITSEDGDRILDKIERSEKSDLNKSKNELKVVQSIIGAYYKDKNILPNSIPHTKKNPTNDKQIFSNSNFDTDFNKSSSELKFALLASKVDSGNDKIFTSEKRFSDKADGTNELDGQIKEFPLVEIKSAVPKDNQLKKDTPGVVNIQSVSYIINNDNRNNNALDTHILQKPSNYISSMNKMNGSMLKSVSKERFTYAGKTQDGDKEFYHEFDMKTINNPTQKIGSSFESNENDLGKPAEQSIPVDKVKEIAMYLSTFAKNHSKLVNLSRKSDKNLEVPTKKAKQDFLKSKLIIQGVEKPGGSEVTFEKYKIPKVVKTYSRKITQNKKYSYTQPAIPEASKELQELCSINLNENQNAGSIDKSDIQVAFCICGDFGNLNCYDSDYPYEHIHFWEHDVVDCDRKTMFSIYNDNFNVSDNDAEKEDNLETQKDCSQNEDFVLHKICWHSNKEIYFYGNEISDTISKLSHTMHLSHKFETNKLVNESSSCVSEYDCSVQQTNLEIIVSTSVAVDQMKNLHSEGTTEKEDVNNSEATITSSCEEMNETFYKGNANKSTMNKIAVKENSNTNSNKNCEFKNETSKKRKEDDTRNYNFSTDQKKCKLEIVDEVNIHSVDNFNLSADSEESFVKSESSMKGDISKQADNTMNVNMQNAVESIVQVDQIVPGKNTEKIKTGEKKRKKLTAREKDDNAMINIKSDVDYEEPANKKSVKCGVCKKLLPKKEWDDHVSTEHCLIAWRSGTSFDFEEPSLLKKLKQKAKLFNLICTFCNAELMKPKQFLTHVQNCFYKLQEINDDITDTSLNNTSIGGEVEDVKHNVKIESHIPVANSVEKCGVCKENISTDDWVDHITQKHEYLAWKEGEPPVNLNDEEEVRLHLMAVVKIVGTLICSKCGLGRKYPKSYMQHIRSCTGPMEETPCGVVPVDDNAVINCGVCGQTMQGSEWIKHIAEKHEYLAWSEGEKPLDINNKELIQSHLYDISQQIGGLVCQKCGITRKYVKPYLTHIASCNGPPELPPPKPFVNPLNKNMRSSSKTSESIVTDDPHNDANNVTVKCDVCQKEVILNMWIEHIKNMHQYMAWKEGESLDENNEEEVLNHLNSIIKEVGCLVCPKCGLTRKNAKIFLKHVEICDKEAKPLIDYDQVCDVLRVNGNLVCAVCSEEIEPKQWYKHKMENHFNVAWVVGSPPVDYKSQSVIDYLLKEYQEKYKLVCNICGISRASRVGFYAHVIACGKSEEEVDKHRNVCDICHKKYLWVYHFQHMAWHNQQEITKVKKLQNAEENERKVFEKTNDSIQEDGATPGRRRAAEKAKHIIETIKSEQEKSDGHKCDEDVFSDSGDSVKLEDYDTGDGTDDLDVDSDISEMQEEEDNNGKGKRKKKPKYSNLKRFPCPPKHLNTFLAKVGVEFRKEHLVDKSLFSKLRELEGDPVPADELPRYLPVLKESCKVQIYSDTWMTYKCFEAVETKRVNATNPCSVVTQILFVGGCIQCVAWAPSGPDPGNSGGNFLAVACHSGADIARYTTDEIAEHPGLIQIWGFGNFTKTAELVFGLAHDYGTVWAMDWCPSGGRDEFPKNPEPGVLLRLGLLAVAFSNGRVLIFSVPFPSNLMKSDNFIRKLKPVAELRLTTNSDRKIFQATSVRWSPQKPHESIVVGYADGTTASYDLNTESPFLKNTENDIMVLYPYHDERSHNTCVTGVDVYPSKMGIGPGGALCVSSPSGAELMARPAVREARQLTHVAVGGALFEPCWPSAALVGDDANVTTSVNEIEWFGGGRRMGGGNAGAGCNHCGHFVIFSQPLLRMRYPHPADIMAKRHVLGLLQMTPLSKKRKKLKNDELQTIVEPTTYEDAINLYGLEFTADKNVIKRAANKPRTERYPERFPLGDVTSMAFCPDSKHHKKLAVATHAGLIFLLQV